MRSGTLTALVVALALGAPAAYAAGKSHTVRIDGMKFIPERLEVAAGDTIVWTNNDFLPHTVTGPNAQFESGELAQNKSWKFVARKKGEIQYICRLHPGMRGVLLVK